MTPLASKIHSATAPNSCGAFVAILQRIIPMLRAPLGGRVCSTPLSTLQQNSQADWLHSTTESTKFANLTLKVDRVEGCDWWEYLVVEDAGQEEIYLNNHFLTMSFIQISTALPIT
jgi:hypothetical protein